MEIGKKAKPRMVIHLVRHGETDACRSPDKSIDKNVNLNARGIEQIRRLRLMLPPPTMIITSPTVRTIESSHLLMDEENRAELLIDSRVWNKIGDYDFNLRVFLRSLCALASTDGRQHTMTVVTHGRIIKMIYCLVRFNCLCTEIMDTLPIEYGDCFELLLVDDEFSMRWARKND